MTGKKGFSVGTKPLKKKILGNKKDYDHFAQKENHCRETKLFPRAIVSCLELTI